MRSAVAGAAKSNDDEDKDPHEALIILEQIADTHELSPLFWFAIYYDGYDAGVTDRFCFRLPAEHNNCLIDCERSIFHVLRETVHDMSNDNRNNNNRGSGGRNSQQGYRGQQNNAQRNGQRPNNGQYQNGQRSKPQNSGGQRPGNQNRGGQAAGGQNYGRSQQRPDYSSQQNYDPNRFVVNISEEDYEGDGSSRKADRSNQHYQRLAPQQRSQQRGNGSELMRRDIPVSRTRVVTSPAGDKYELPEENNLPPKLLRKQQRNPKSRGCVVAVVYSIIVVSISALLAFYLIVGINDMFGLVKEEMEVVVTLEDGADLDDVTRILEENGVVDYPFFFKLYASLTMDADFKHGEFTLNAKSDYDMIIRKLTRPSTADKSVVKVTIPEGLNLEQIAELLEYNCVCEKEAFFNTIATYEFKHEFYKDIPKDEETRLYKLEGYLFPDTYSFYIWEGSVSAINRMLNAFDDKVYDNDELGLAEKAKKLGMTMDDIITMASIIEREVPDPEQMKNVASVFYNRMKNPSYEGTGGKLQSDATMWYPFPTKAAMLESETLTDEEKKNWQSTNYDTTLFSGLPAGPICCPGLNAITAALNPNDTKYYFFYTAEDSQGVMQYYYANTYAEHQQNYG